MDTPSGSFPGLVAAMNAAARDINASGGINGHPVKVQSCNGKTEPNQEVTCGRQAVASNAVAVVAPLFPANPGGVLKVLEAGQMTDLAGGAVSTTELSSPIAFHLDAGPLTPAGCLQLVKSKVATKMATISSDLAAIKGNADFVAKSGATVGVPMTTSVVLPPTAPDVTAQVQQVINSGADGAIMLALPNQAAQVLQASAQLGKKLTFCSSDGLLYANQLTALGPAAANVYVAATMPPLSDADSNPAVAHFISDMKAEEASGDKDASLDMYVSSTLRAWAGMQAFAQIAKSISGPVTRASFLAATSKATDVTTGIFPPVNFTKPISGAGFTRLFNPTLKLLKWDVAKKEFVSTDLVFDASSLTN